MEKKPRKTKNQPQKPVEKKEVPNQPVEKKPAKKISKAKDLLKLLNLLKVKAQLLDDLSKEFNLDHHTLCEMGESLSKQGHDVRRMRIDGGKEALILALGADLNDEESISISKANKTFKILILSEIRMGARQSQISALHWIYKEVIEREDIDFVVIAGGLVIGKPTVTLLPDAIITDPDEIVDYVVKHFPKTDKVKTYIVPGKGEIKWKKTSSGQDILSAICAKREDLKLAAGANQGALAKNFKIKGVTIRVTAPFEDNSPRSTSTGPQNLIKKLCRNQKKPDILVVGMTHRRSFMPVYNSIYAITPPSLHTQMRRQENRHVPVYVGYTILELNFKEDWSIDLGAGGLKVDHRSLDNYVVENDCYDLGLSNVENLNKDEKLVLEWLSRDFVVSAGDISRRLKKSKETVSEIIAKLNKCGYTIEFGEATKAYEFKVKLKEKFFPLPLKYEDIYVWATKEAAISDPHLCSKEDLTGVHCQAYEDVAKEGCRIVSNSGDVFDGPGMAGYKGHARDVRCVEVDEIVDYGVKVWPRVLIKVLKKPLKIFERFDRPETGGIGYKETEAKIGSEVLLQTFAIEGNHEGWAEQLLGIRMVRFLAIRLSNLIRYAGSQYGSFFFDNIYHVLIHPAGGGGAMLSNVVEKHLESTREFKEDESKPTVVYIGHLHSCYFLFDTRYGVRMPSMKRVDQFHRTHALVPYIGSVISEMFTDKDNKGFTRIIMEYRDYRPLAREVVKTERTNDSL